MQPEERKTGTSTFQRFSAAPTLCSFLLSFLLLTVGCSRTPGVGVGEKLGLELGLGLGPELELELELKRRALTTEGGG